VSNERPSLVILGAGPAGLGAAWQVARSDKASVTLLERAPRVGGNAGSFELAGMPVDFGSHRLHPASDDEILADIREMLGEDLLDRPRHGRIRLRGRWIHFPLKPVDLALGLPPSFGLSVARDQLLGRFRAPTAGAESFASVVETKLGRTIAHDFYLPYARKIWGVAPEELSPIQARRRVSADSPAKLVRKVLSAVPGLRPKGAGRFFYPRGGFGQICEAYHEQALAAGARVELGAEVEAVELDRGGVVAVRYRSDGRTTTLPTHRVWSTIPISTLTRMLEPAAPAELLQAADEIQFRSMLLIYLVVDQPRFSEFDAHYFPETSIPITRLSEPKNYAARDEPAGRTVLCAELPCSREDDVWSMEDVDLGRLVSEGLAGVGLPLGGAVLDVVVRRLGQAYPIYLHGYERGLEAMDRHLAGIERLLTYGRQGLFAHDNTHHALYMAYAASRCLDAAGGFDQTRWADFREIFNTHVVED